MGILVDLIKGRFGIETTPIENPIVAAVGVAAILVARNHPDRVSLNFINLSANTIYIAPFPTVSAVNGIILDPNGGWRSFVWDEDFELVGKDWYAIATGAASAFYTLESIGRK